MVSLINDVMIGSGKAPLGFLNPLLYRMAKERPDAFIDINTGDNKCNRAWCCKYGYDASVGWVCCLSLPPRNHLTFCCTGSCYWAWWHTLPTVCGICPTANTRTNTNPDITTYSKPNITTYSGTNLDAHLPNPSSESTTHINPNE